MDGGFEESALARDVISYHCSRCAELPSLELYMDQVLVVVQGALSPLADGDEKLITNSMVNNYVKKHIIPAPRNKKYNRVHLMWLVALCALKKAMSIPEIEATVRHFLRMHSPETVYDYFCEELECALRATFRPDKFTLREPSAGDVADGKLARSVALCLANKIYIQKLLRYQTDYDGAQG